WRARDELLHRDVALKRIHLGPEVDAERAEREALAAARLAHPAIVALYEACAREDAFYLISELVDGDTLARLIADDALYDDEILEIGLALTGALTHAHARGVVHRDIKPHNVLVPRIPGDGAAAKLTDFGGATLTGEDALTRTGDVLGTLAYMAPEQSEGKDAGPAADLYSLALVLYEALSGANPVRGATPAATVRRIGGPIMPLARARRDLDPRTTRAIDRALASDPARRGSLAELSAALRTALGDPARAPAADNATDADDARAPYLPRARTRVAPLPARAPAVPPRPGVVEADPGGAHAEALAPPRRGVRRIHRSLWLAAGLLVAIWQAIAGRPGAALLALAAFVPLLALPRRAGPGWLAGALAPALGTIGLAGAFPAVAGQARSVRERACLGALGYWWLTLAEPVLGRTLWFGPRPGTPAPAGWEGSLHAGAAHVLSPLLSVTVLLGALLWAAGAALVPLLIRGRSAPLDIVAAAVWASALAAAAPALAADRGSYGADPTPRGMVLGALVGAVVAVAARALRGPVRPKGA
ncbi:MAG TPA: serine/threonine-protein kinase, partial [Solirubrobacteraceae bacterium]|nr:serine/threonine-protein kinase [Solirubrobacteraceae bacterium]